MVSFGNYFSRLLLPYLIPLFAIDALGDSSELSGPLYPNTEWNSPRYDYWIEILGETIGKSAAMQSIVASSMVDTNGDLYNIIYTNINSNGALYFIIKRAANTSQICRFLAWYPWKFLYDQVVPQNPYYVGGGDRRYFQQCFYNAFQPCIAQEIENDDYLYVVVYAPITRLYTNDNSNNKEGFVIGKFSKELSKQAEGFIHSATYRTCPRDKFELETGNVQAWHDSGNLHLNYIYLETPNNASTARWFQAYCTNFPTYSSGSLVVAKAESVGITSEASSIAPQPRAIKYGDYIYQLGSNRAVPYIAKMQKDQTDIVCWIDGTCDPFSLCSNTNIRRCWDFCIVDNPYSTTEPIFCVLGLQCPNTGTSSTRISQNNNLWKGAEKGSENPNLSWESNNIVLLLSSAPWNTSTWRYFKAIGFGPEDPQNVIYSTGVTLANSSSKFDVGYKPEQLYYNTHKICTYTSGGGGRKYIIYCYCYPGNKRYLYLGYASYVVRKNSQGIPKVCLLTKTEKCISKTCNRIFHMDCRNGHLWITWIGGKSQTDNDDSTYYYYHIKTDELIQE